MGRVKKLGKGGVGGGNGREGGREVKLTIQKLSSPRQTLVLLSSLVFPSSKNCGSKKIKRKKEKEMKHPSLNRSLPLLWEGRNSPYILR